MRRAALTRKSAGPNSRLVSNTRRVMPSTADLKFLHYLQRVHLREFRIESGTRIIKLLVPFAFRGSLRGCCDVSRTSESWYQPAGDAALLSQTLRRCRAADAHSSEASFETGQGRFSAHQ